MVRSAPTSCNASRSSPPRRGAGGSWWLRSRTPSSPPTLQTHNSRYNVMSLNVIWTAGAGLMMRWVNKLAPAGSAAPAR
jgi:hypothetical protein